MQTTTFFGATVGDRPMIASLPWRGTRFLVCRCGQCVDAPIPPQDWLVTKIEDRGAAEYYRYRVEGVNFNHAPCDNHRRFTWRVPALCERFDLSSIGK